MQFKRFETKAEQTDSKITFVASTANPDRYGDVVDQKGWDLKAYERNPVVLLNHNPNQLPIGKGRAYVKNGQLMLDVEFDKNDEMAQRVEQKVKGGFINAVSVGFQPSESISRSKLPSDHPYHGKSGYYFQKSELLEVSIVTIPANNEATLSKHFVQKVGLQDVVKSMIVHRHIVSVQELDNGNYVVEFTGIQAEEIEEIDDDETEDLADEPIEEGYDEEESKEERELEDEEEEDKEKSFCLDEFLKELKSINQQ